MGCGAYHSVVTIGETRFEFKKYNLEMIKKTIKKLIPGTDIDLLRDVNSNNQSGVTTNTQPLSRVGNSKPVTPHKL